ncbi:MAG: toxin-antitoxin system YwqK family antitoxin [Ferruginibacter sp.]
MKKIIAICLLVSVSIIATAQVKKEYYPSGKLESIGKYNGDIKIGEWKYYYESGSLLESGEYNNKGYRINKWNTYHENGKLASTGKYDKDGEQTGKWSNYHENGKLESCGVFISTGYETGIWKFYDENGKFSFDRDYSDGTTDPVAPAAVKNQINRADRFFMSYVYDSVCKTGISFGRIKNRGVGMYLTARFNSDGFKTGGANGIVDNKGVVTGGQFSKWGNDWRFKNEIKTGNIEIMAGLTQKITYPLWIYAGAGASFNTVFWKMDIYDNLGDYFDTDWVKNDEASKLKPVFEGGLIVDLGGFNIRGGVKTQTFKEMIVTMGLGFSFKW